MRELLFLPENLAQPLRWATYAPDGSMALHDPIIDGSVSAYKNLNKKGVTLIIPGQQAPSYRFSMPKVTGQAKQQAIAFALEGICSQSLDDVYVIAGDYVNGKQSAVVIEKPYLDGALQLAKDKGLKVLAIQIDYMLLKKPQAHAWVATQIEHDILWRTDEGTGGRVEAQLWPVILSQIFDQKNRPFRELIWSLDDHRVKPLALPESLQKQCAEFFQTTLSWIDPNSLQSPSLYVFNIGSNALRSLLDKRKKIHSRAFVIFTCAIVFALISQASFTAFVDIKLSKEQALLNTWLKPLGFENTSLYEIKSRLKQAIASAQTMQSADSFTLIISAIAPLLSQDEKNQLINISYTTQSGLTLEFPMDHVAAITQHLKMQMPSYEVNQIMPSKGEDSSSALIVIKKAGP
jgi:type II secretory pathway component PulL